MHVPDGFLDAPTSVATGVLAAGTVALALRGSRRELDERTAPLAGLTAAFVFAVQMMNFPVGAGTSGHLIGGALTAVLVGPWTAVLCMTVVLVVQAVLFADGGLTALGTNVTLMGLVAVALGYGVTRLVVRLLPRTRTGVLVGAAVGAFVSVPAAAMAFVGLFAVGGVADVSLGAVAATMGGIHLLIGLGEAAITAAVLSAVLAVRPDLVHGAAHLRRPADLAPRPLTAPAAGGVR
ncbi:energy-coupling factor ABC transporter permease [Blastococcus sp. SYSU D00695]